MTRPESSARLPGKEQLESLHGWICIAMNKAAKRFVKGKGERATWWTEQLKDLKSRVAKARKQWQLTRKRERNLPGSERCRFEYYGLLKHYKKTTKETKVLWWRNFVRFVANTDPWGAVYKLYIGVRRTKDW